MNIQHLESLNDQVFQITGIRVRETVPDWFVKSAAEVVMVDATTGALLNRLKRGDIYAPEKAQRAMENFFKESTLTALRELALRQAAHELDLREIASTSEERRTQQEVSSASPSSPMATIDRILIYVSADASTAMLIRRGRRMADYLGADCFAVSVGAASGQSSRANARSERSGKALELCEKSPYRDANLANAMMPRKGSSTLHAAIKLRRSSSAAAIIARGAACSELISFCESFARQKIFG